jgi:exopolyphosphatase/guanosine-5'-triphosphate,3'-diphosphate pyrophosphatase
VRVTERFFDHDPPEVRELARAADWLADQYARAAAQVPALKSGQQMLGLAGTVSALAQLVQGLERYDRDAVHHYRLSRAAVDHALGELASLPTAQRSLRPGIEEARAPFVVGGVLVLSTLMAYFSFEECLVSESDILDGLSSALRRRTRACG